jgi:NAD-dependent SIR2 family protein deacetylase
LFLKELMKNMEVQAEYLAEFLGRHRRLTVLTGAGCSSESGIPEYRDDDGNWQHAKPMNFSEFTGSEAGRKRYWARSFMAWQRFSAAEPNAAHLALASMETLGYVDTVVTQNVDGLHRRAGNRRLVELHGALHKVRCLGCAAELQRDWMQAELTRRNVNWRASAVPLAPDGDAHIDSPAIDQFTVVDCAACGGVLKPDVVFFGEAVPKSRVAATMTSLQNSGALLVVGSSLMVYSAYRVVRQAAESGKPVAILNRGKTRADELATLRLRGNCAAVLPATLRLL